ncbi:MAG: hypothetical protein KJ550_12590 [Proteobacteria bacterium]|nr:hypothetical protein [Desulfobacteraceae bacterium]MBU4014282.1 hypothetical protein [Pseudomonadota bacterium]MBU4067908.1 hypothetical protein [Pseudomonadota bacterium]MBU4103423.1 hypothetical protein [Patescibacteria group bacterium]
MNLLPIIQNSSVFKDQFSAWHTPEAPFLIDLFQQIAVSGINYAVLRNYDFLPYGLHGSDIDILFSEDSFAKAHMLLACLVKRHGGKIICQLKAHRVKSLMLCGCGAEKRWWGVRIDSFTYVGTNGVEFLSAKSVISRCVKHNNIINVADFADDAIIAFLKEVIGAGRVRRDYDKKAISVFLLHGRRYERNLIYYFGAKTYTKWLIPSLSGKYMPLKKLQMALKVGWLKNMLLKHPAKVLRSRFLDFSLRLKRFFAPLGFSCAVIGTDGSGKSTIIEGIRPPLESALHTKLNYEHMRPNLLPSIACLFGRQTEDGPVTNPHGSKASGFFGSFLRLSYYSLDYILGYWLKVYPAKVKRPCLYVFDRYFYDFITDPARSRISLPKWLIKLFAILIPTPDLILCLGADPAVIHARKPELPLIEVERQISELKKFCDSSPNAVWIDTAQSIEKSIDHALEAITDHMAARYE